MTVYIDGIEVREYTAAEEKHLYAPLYESVLNILGSTGVIIPIGDTNHENAGRTTVTTVGEEAAVFTYPEAVSGFDTIPSLLGPSRIPIVHFNGSDEYAESPDDGFWTRDDAGGANGFTIGVWANLTNITASRALLGKFDNDGDQEWLLFANWGTDQMQLQIIDSTVGVICFREEDADAPLGTLTHWVVTYDGQGGALAADGIRIYRNGVLSASTATNNGSYVGMRNTALTVNVGRNVGTSGRYFLGSMAGGPLAPFFVPSELTADAVRRLFQLGRAALDV